jgi:DNA-binding winged helix-turn-helix (wHTH) protein/tetratricopeptide (TPR) repeat protein
MGAPFSEVTTGGRKLDELRATTGGEGDARRLAFGPFVLEPESGRLLEGPRVVPLAPKPFETLLYLAQRPGRVVPKAELMEKLWPQTFVTDDVLVQCVVEIRRALGDPAKTPQYVQTVPRRGYQFLAAVRPLDQGADAPPTVPVDLAGTDALSLPATGSWLTDHAWRRRGTLLAVGLLLAVAAAAYVAGRRAAAVPASAPAPAAERGSLVVLPMLVEEPTPQSGWLRQGLAEMIRAQLGQTPGIHVVARHRLAAALAEAGHADDQGPTRPEVAAQVARRLNAERLVTGSYVRVDDRFVLTAQLVDVASGRTEGTASVRGVFPADLLDSVDELCLKLLHQLSPTREPGGDWKPTRLATRSVEASRHYIEAQALLNRGGRQAAEEAEARLEQALELDPGFAQAYVKKAEIQQSRRRWGYGDPDPAPAVRAAARLMKELPDRERLLVESFEALIVRQKPAVALRDWNALLQFYPTYAQEVGVPGLVAETFMQEGRWDELILVGEAHVESPSLPEPERARLSSTLAHAFRRKGEFQRALQHAQHAVRLWPNREGPAFLHQRTVLGRIALEAGRREEALAEFRAAARAREADATNLATAAWGLYMAGEAGEASLEVDRALKVDPGYGNAYHLRGWLRLTGGEHAAAAEDFRLAFERTPRAFGTAHHGLVNGDLAALYYSGVAWLQADQRAQGRQALERLVAHCQRLMKQRAGQAGPAPDWQLANFLARAQARLGLEVSQPARLAGDDTTYFVQTARLHAVQGRRDQALKELSQGLTLGHGELRHVQDDPDFAPLRATAEFKRLVTDRLPR